MQTVDDTLHAVVPATATRLLTLDLTCGHVQIIVDNNHILTGETKKTRRRRYRLPAVVHPRLRFEQQTSSLQHVTLRLQRTQLFFLRPRQAVRLSQQVETQKTRVVTGQGIARCGVTQTNNEFHRAYMMSTCSGVRFTASICTACTNAWCFLPSSCNTKRLPL